MEGRLAVLLTNREDELIEGQRRIEWMVDRLALMYLIHTPEVPEEVRDGAVVNARRRYANYLRAVDRMLAKEQPQGVKEDGSEGGGDG
jgi:hypothetical protein